MASQDWLDKDFYKVLGVSKDTSEAELKKVYRKLAREFHPDSNQGNAKAEAKFKEISEAYSVLSDKEQRAEYDQITLLASGIPRCYRHPGTTTYIRCQRCERYVCLQCQTQAPVGVICPECLGQAQARAPRVGREALGGRSNQTPVVTYTLIAITAFFYVIQWIPGLEATNYLAYSPLYSYGEYAAIGAPYEPWRMLTSVFTHSTGFVFHILLNMYTLWIFGQMLERMLGKARFITLYLASGLAGSLGVMYWAPHDTFVVGASGAIFGLMGAYLVIQRKLGGETTQLLVLVGINLVIGFLPGMSVSWQAHLGGLLGGALLGFIFVQTRKYTQKRLQLGLVSLTVLAFVALALSHAPMFVQG